VDASLNSPELRVNVVTNLGICLFLDSLGEVTGKKLLLT
jgi:hypothetical protein